MPNAVICGPHLLRKPGLVGHVRFLKGEGGSRHATLTEVREDD
jgi:hypothetical protein